MVTNYSASPRIGSLSCWKTCCTDSVVYYTSCIQYMTYFRIIPYLTQQKLLGMKENMFSQSIHFVEIKWNLENFEETFIDFIPLEVTAEYRIAKVILNKHRVGVILLSYGNRVVAIARIKFRISKKYRRFWIRWKYLSPMIVVNLIWSEFKSLVWMLQQWIFY